MTRPAFSQNDKVLVARSNGSWTKAVVSDVDATKRVYRVFFSDGQRKSVVKEITFAAAAYHLKHVEGPSDADGKLDDVQQRRLDEIARNVKEGMSFEDAVAQQLSPDAQDDPPALLPWARAQLGPIADGVEELVRYLAKASEGDRSPDLRSLVSDWAAPVSGSPVSRGVPVLADTQQAFLAETQKAEQPAAAAGGDVDWAFLVGSIGDINSLIVSARQLAQIGSPSDDDISQREAELRECDEIKNKITAELTKVAGRVKVPADSAGKIAEFLGTICKEGDGREGSPQLVHALLTKLDAEYAAVIQRDNLLVEQCVDGNIDFFRDMLHYCAEHRLENVYDLAEVLASACFSQTARIPLVLLLMRTLDTKPIIDEVASVLAEFFESITSDEKRHAKEDRTGFLELCDLLLSYKELALDVDAFDSAGRNLTARCCIMGDVDLLKLVQVHAPASVRPSQALEDDLTPLMHAVFKNRVDMVDFLLRLPNCDADAETKAGTALGFADALQRTEIIQLLKAAGAEKSVFTGT
ncbi:hypothetical protein DIPPA_11855 [Diplonema papillatum]|nr:hypothetical protein DIPPA_11855 [Diplonema papillatum]